MDFIIWFVLIDDSGVGGGQVVSNDPTQNHAVFTVKIFVWKEQK